MKKLIAVIVLVTFGVASCGKKKQATPAGGGGSGSTADPGGSGAGAAMRPAPPDPVREALAAANAEVIAMVAAGRTAGTPAPAVDVLGRVVDHVTEAMQAREAEARQAWDPAAVVAAAGTERVALFRWVRDQTALVPYRGALRGAVGVMMDRVGNSLDRALLLADLLTRAGIQARLVNAQLPPDAIAKLAAAWSTRARPALPTNPLAADALNAKIATDLGLDPAALAARTAKAAAAARAVADAARVRIDAQTKALGAVVPATAAAAPDPAPFADHWWVQAEDSGVWQDLDPSLPDAEPGQALAPAGETLAPDALPDDQRHTMTVRVVAEVWHGDAREETTLLEQTLVPAQVFGQRITLTTVPIDMPDEDTALASPGAMNDWRAALARQTEWLPVLRVGAAVVVKMSVTDGGELYDVSAPDANTTRLARAIQRATKNGVGGAAVLLDSLPDQAGEDPVAPPPPLAPRSGFTAEWLEVELRAPGAAPVTVRRVVFDALGIAGDRTTARPRELGEDARTERGFALTGETELLPMFARIPEAFVDNRTAGALLEARPVLTELLGVRPGAVSPELRDRIHRLTPVPGPLYGLALARFAWSGVGDQVYLDQLDVLTRRQRFVQTPGGYVARDGFDILVNRVSVWPHGITGDPRAIRIAQGVADTVAEAGVLDCTARTQCSRDANTSEDFAASAGKGWVATAAAPPAAAPGMAADLAAGYAVVAAPGTPTWWRVDPATGETLGMSARGGSVSAETALMYNTALFTMQMGKCIITAAHRGHSAGGGTDWGGIACVAGALLGFGAGVASPGLGFAISVINMIIT